MTTSSHPHGRIDVNRIEERKLSPDVRLRAVACHQCKQLVCVCGGSTERSVEQKRRLRFAPRGMSARDEALFKSFSKILSHRLRHVWTFDEDAPDLVVEVKEKIAHSFKSYELRTNSDGIGVQLDVTRPVQALLLESALNEAGDVILARRALRIGKSLQMEPVVRPHPAVLMRLTRWPPAHLLLNRTSHVRLATLLSARSYTLEQLAAHSGMEFLTCVEFCEAARAGGVLEMNVESFAPPEIEAEAHGRPRTILGLIRSKLGLGRQQA